MRRLAIAEALAGLALLCAMDALIKGVAQRLPVFEIAFARYLFGSVLILGFEGSFSGLAAVLVSAVTYALSMVLLRARAQTDPVVTIVAIQNVAPSLILLVPALLIWEPPTPAEWGTLALIGALGVLGHLVMARAYAKAEAARLASLEYTALLWASLFGFAFFGEVPTVTTLAGAALIVGGAVVASRR